MVKARPIGGWLILFAIGLIGSILIDILILYRYLNSVVHIDYNYLLSNYSKEEANLIYFEVIYPFVSCIIVFCITIILAYLFFTKHKEFPKAYIYLNITCLFIVMSLEYVSIIYGEAVYFKNTVCGTIALVVWGIYLMKSKRVKETFVNKKRKKYIKITVEEYELIKQAITNKGEKIEI